MGRQVCTQESGSAREASEEICCSEADDSSNEEEAIRHDEGSVGGEEEGGVESLRPKPKAPATGTGASFTHFT